eukprot:4731931-Pleurochrysis_carterae.AAC.1
MGRAPIAPAAQRLEKLPLYQDSAIVEEAFVGRRSNAHFAVAALELSLQVGRLDVKLPDAAVGNASHRTQELQCDGSCSRCERLEGVLRGCDRWYLILLTRLCYRSPTVHAPP